jgi:hypothetical protein
MCSNAPPISVPAASATSQLNADRDSSSYGVCLRPAPIRVERQRAVEPFKVRDLSSHRQTDARSSSATTFRTSARHQMVYRGPQHHWDFGPMPAIPGRSDAEVEDIITCVRALQRGPPNRPEPVQTGALAGPGRSSGKSG